MNNGKAPTVDIKKIVENELYAQTVDRCFYISLVGIVSFLYLGFCSFSYLSKFDPSITFWGNIWPRIIFSCLPWLLLALYMKRSRASNKKKIIFWSIANGLIFNLTGWIHIWPLALSGHPETLLFVSGQNGAYFFGVWVMLALPTSITLHCLVIAITTLWAPFFLIASRTNSPIIFLTTANDTAGLILLGFIGGYFVSRLYKELATIKAEKQIEAAKFLGNDVYSAIYEDKHDLLKEETRTGYVLYIDIRNSTQMTTHYKNRWEAFGKAWMAAAAEIIPGNRGNLLKTGGDSLLITFGVFDEATPDLSDIPGLERDEISAENQRWKELTFHCFTCTHKLILKFQELSKLHFPDVPVKLGAGIDRGPIHRGVRGSAQKMELDIWGDRVNCSARLQDYSKNVASNFEKDSSLLVVSPFAGDYLEDQNNFKTHLITDGGIKDYPGIKWVLVKEYAYYLKATEDSGLQAA